MQRITDMKLNRPYILYICICLWLLFLLGDVYVRKGDNFQARATYQSVADGYSPADDGIVAEAKERIAKLN